MNSNTYVVQHLPSSFALALARLHLPCPVRTLIEIHDHLSSYEIVPAEAAFSKSFAESAKHLVITEAAHTHAPKSADSLSFATKSKTTTHQPQATTHCFLHREPFAFSFAAHFAASDHQ